MEIMEVLTTPRSPWQSPYVERLIGSIRRECLDHLTKSNTAKTPNARLFIRPRSLNCGCLNGQATLGHTPENPRDSNTRVCAEVCLVSWVNGHQSPDGSVEGSVTQSSLSSNLLEVLHLWRSSIKLLSGIHLGERAHKPGACGLERAFYGLKTKT